MPRNPRIDFTGAWHHVMHRGARRAPIFDADDHCTVFLDTLGDVVRRFELEVHAYALMVNHYHLLVRSRHGNLSAAMKRLNATYTQQLNLVHGWDGPLFRGRFHSELVRSETHLPYVLAYIHLNPLRANLVTRLDAHCWTSHRAYLGRDKPPVWLTREHFLALFGAPNALHDHVLALHRGKLDWPESMRLETGWLGSVEELGDSAVQRDRDPTTTRFVTAERALERVTALTGMPREVLLTSRLGPSANAARRFAVWALRRQTLLTQKEVGSVLGMSTQQVAHVLRRLDLRAEPFDTWSDKWLADG